VSARIERARVGAAGRDRDRLPLIVPPPDDGLVAVEGDPVDRLETLLTDIRRTWSQTTFYLWDPNSWR